MQLFVKINYTKQSHVLNILNHVKDFYEKRLTCADSDLIDINLNNINVDISKSDSDISSTLENENRSGHLVLIDFEKTFESVSWPFIYKALEYFGLRNNTINWMNILIKDFKVCVLQCHSAVLSDRFKIQRGCRHGDPEAPYVLLICAEI